ncbi:MAG: hypothetical protein AB1489_16435, partial [Acidobacteriota bacterium]
SDFSYQPSFTQMWHQAMSFAVPEKLTAQEVSWQQHVTPRLSPLTKRFQQLSQQGYIPATLEWAKKIRPNDIAVLEGREPFNRYAPKEDINKLRLLRGHIRSGQFITKIRKIFTQAEMSEDLVFLRATLDGKSDDIEYYSILPTSPP